MSRVYGEPVEVQTRRDGGPDRFVWRERRYSVIAVQEYWLVNRDWWRESSPVPARPELQFWRVEAMRIGPARADGHPAAGTYELRLDVAAGTWTLRRVAD
jgi:hypothetical protein